MLAARHRARLAMQDSNADTAEVCLRPNLRAQNVRRRLFVDEGDVDRQEDKRGLDDNLRNELVEGIRENLEKAKERWNFDFEKEKPLPGNYDWVKLDKDGNEIQDSAEIDDIAAAENANNTEESNQTTKPGVNETDCKIPQGLNQSD